MKLNKIFAFALAALMTTACSSDDESFNFNTAADVTVEMGESYVEVMENVGIFTIPVKVTGNPNGYVQITVECAEIGTDPAIENRHYYLTTDVINIPQDDKEGIVQFTTVDRRGLDPNRTYTCTIVNVKGGVVGAQKTTTIQIDDKGSSPTLQELPGQWLVIGKQYNTTTNAIDEEFFSECKMRVTDVGENGSGTVVLTGFLSQWQIQLYYDYDNEEKYGELQFKYGSPAASGYDIRYTNSSGSYDLSPLIGKWNFSFTSATFGDSETIIAMSAFENDKFRALYWLISGFTITKIPES